MTSDFIDCPDGGKCGRRKHQIGSDAYKRCLRKRSSSVARSPFAHAGLTGVPVGDKKYVDGSRLLSMTKAFRNSGSTYLQGYESFFSQVPLENDQVQQYIDNPRGVHFSEWQENRVKNSIRDNIEDIAEEADIDIDSLSTEEIDMTCQAAYNSISQRDAVHDMARGMAPRTFTYNCVDPEQPNSPNSRKTRDAFSEAMENYEVGSDEWYDTIAAGYISDMRQQKRLTHGPTDSEDEELIAADRKAIASALKDAIDESIELESADSYYDLPGIDIAWTGPLSDTAPDSDYSKTLRIQQPYVVFTDPYAGAISNPVRLSGSYSIDIGSSDDGVESGIIDDMTREYGQFFHYQGNSGLSSLDSKTVKY